MPRRRFPFRILVMLACLLSLAVSTGGCRQDPGTRSSAREPIEAVATLSRTLRENDLHGFVRVAVPPELLPGLEVAWRSGRSRWPLDELPFDSKIPNALASLSADKADKVWRSSFDRQFANAHGEIRAAATSLGLFGVKYIQSDISLSADERHHYPQLISALSDWAQHARLGDPKRAHRAIAQLTTAARQSGLREEGDFARYGMDGTLTRLGPFMDAFKRALREYGLDLDHSLDAMVFTLVSQQGDHARVRMRYPLAGKTIETTIDVEQVEGYWYVSDFLRHARAAAASVEGGPAAISADSGARPQPKPEASP